MARVIKQSYSADEMPGASAAAASVRPDAPVAVAYFTNRSEDAKAQNALRMPENMSVSARHFHDQAQKERAARAARAADPLHAPRPTAMEHFEKIRREKDAASEADAAEITRSPAPAAMEHFSWRAKAKGEMKRQVLSEVTHDTGAPNFVTQHLANKWVKKEPSTRSLASSFTSVASSEGAAPEEDDDREDRASVATRHFRRLALEQAEDDASVASAPAEVLSGIRHLAEKMGGAKARPAASRSMTVGQAYFTPALGSVDELG